MKRRIAPSPCAAAIIDSIDLKRARRVDLCVARSGGRSRQNGDRWARRKKRNRCLLERPTVWRARPGQTRVAVARPRAARWHWAGTPARMTDCPRRLKNRAPSFSLQPLPFSRPARREGRLQRRAVTAYPNRLVCRPVARARANFGAKPSPPALHCPNPTEPARHSMRANTTRRRKRNL